MIGDQIKELRAFMGETQQEFADKLGMPRATVAGYEASKREPNNATVSLICRVYGLNETWLRTGEGEMLAARNRNQLLMDYVDECMNKPDSFKARFSEGMAKLTDEQWDQVAAIVNTILDQKK